MGITVDIRNCTRRKAFPRVMRKAVIGALRLAGARGIIEVSVALVGEQKIRSLNRKWRKKRGPTDVLSFGFWKAPEGTTRGEIVICVPYAERQARTQRISFARHLAMLAAHGAIHLQGIDHERSETERCRTEEIQQKVARRVT